MKSRDILLAPEPPVRRTQREEVWGFRARGPALLKGSFKGIYKGLGGRRALLKGSFKGIYKGLGGRRALLKGYFKGIFKGIGALGVLLLKGSLKGSIRGSGP